MVNLQTGFPCISGTFQQWEENIIYIIAFAFAGKTFAFSYTFVFTFNTFVNKIKSGDGN